MGTMKKIRTYLIIFIIGFLFVELFTNLAMKEKFVDITKHYISITSPKINVTESKASYGRGYINGNIINNTGEHIKDKYIQFDFYDKDGIYVGTESKELKYFNVDEKISFNINYEYKNVDKIKISFVEEVIQPKNNAPSFFNINIEEENLKIALPIALALGLYVILP